MTIPKSLRIVLTSVYLILFLLTLTTGDKTASGGNPFFCLSLPWSLPLVARDDTATVAAVGVLALVWWYFIGYIGYAGSVGKLSRTGATLGAGLVVLMCVVEAAMLTSEFQLISRESNYGAIDRVIYAVAGMLLLGGVVSAGCGAIAGFRRS